MSRKEGLNLNAAAFGALVRGDVDNFLVAATPGGIEAQEAAGQRQLVASSQLPRKGSLEHKAELEEIGFKFLGDADDLFVNVELPSGWKKEATDHDMWSKLLDEKDRERAFIFYKAAFYDRRAHMSWASRFCVEVRTEIQTEDGRDFWSFENGEKTMAYAVVLDHQTESERFRTHSQPVSSYREVEKTKKRLLSDAHAWLKERYPKHDRPFAHWDDK